jgi:ribosomal protein S18 acetylase RimI-like enzyme
MQKEVNPSKDPFSNPSYLEATRSYFARALAEGSYFSAVAEEGGLLLGANGMVLYDKPPSILGGVGRIAHVSNVYTLPEHRGRGIATRLMQLLVDRARREGADYMELGATDAGRSVYERVGFKTSRFPSLELRFY